MERGSRLAGKRDYQSSRVVVGVEGQQALSRCLVEMDGFTYNDSDSDGVRDRFDALPLTPRKHLIPI